MTRGVFRIKLGRVTAQHGDEKGRPINYIMNHGDNLQHIKPLKEKGKIKDLEKARKEREFTITSQCRKAKEELEKHSIPEEEGPYADVQERVDALAKTLDGGNLEDTIEYIIDSIRPFDTAEREVQFPRHHSDPRFAVDDSYIYPDDGLVTAGSLLTDIYGTYEDDISGAKYSILGDQLEPIIIAVGVLRKLGYDAYPAMAQVRIGEERELIPTAMLAVLKPESETPLITFQLLRSHPIMEAIDLISDEAMLGATYAIKAANEGKKLTREMLEHVIEKNKVIPEEEILERLKEIGDILYECISRWEDSPVKNNAIITIGQYVYNAVKDSLMIMSVREEVGTAERNLKEANALILQGDTSAETMKKAEALQAVLENPESVINPYMERNAGMVGDITAERYSSHIIHYLGMKYAKEANKEN